MKKDSYQIVSYLLFIISILFLLVNPIANGAVINIPADYLTIQEGLNSAVDGDTVLVADGTYTGAGNVNLDFNGKALSLVAANGPEDCVIDCQLTARALYLHTYEPQETLVQGFTMINGYTEEHGGAALCDSALATFTGCVFTNNVSASSGGAIAIRNTGNVVVDECTFIGNQATIGGAIASDSSSPSINACIFHNNNASEAGGAMMIIQAPGSEIADCEISGNGSFSGGGIVLANSSAAIVECVISHNIALYVAGGILIGTVSSVRVDSCTVTDNWAQSSGGGIHCEYSSADIDGSTLSGNMSDFGGGITFTDAEPYAGQSKLSFCIISGNHANWGAGCYFEGGTCSIETNYFTDNTARFYGGGIYTGFISGNPLTIGGLPETGNFFERNSAIIGHDLCCAIAPDTPINAQYNHFNGIAISDYYASPNAAFDLQNCISQTTPITQDVFVSPTGSDNNSGLSQDAPFLTIQKALSSVYADETNPLTIHLWFGRYCPSQTGEVYPLPMLPWVTVRGAAMQTTILDAEYSESIIVARLVDETFLTDVTATHSFGHFFAASIMCERASLSITNCIITDNVNTGIFCLTSSAEIANCMITNNHFESGAGILLLEDYGTRIINCLIAQNQSAQFGSGVFCGSGVPRFINCTIADNSTVGIYCDNSEFTLQSCIVWGNEQRDLFITGGQPAIAHSDIGTVGVFPGTGNINADPLFVAGVDGEYYLSHTASGQNQDSPCINGGHDEANEVCMTDGDEQICLDSFTTRTDAVPDAGIVDIGFHYGVEPLITPTSVPTESPTAEPTISPTPEPLELTVDLFLNHVKPDCFSGGYTFYMKADFVSNYDYSADFYVVLEAFNEYYFYPTWTSDLDNEQLDIPAGHSVKDLLLFTWPFGGGYITSMKFHAALLEPDTINLLSYDVVEFCSEPEYGPGW